MTAKEESIMATETTQRSWIQKTPDRCGGNACIRNTRITVWGLVEWRQMGQFDEWILEGLPDLTQADLEEAWLYAAANPTEIVTAIRENAEA